MLTILNHIYNNLLKANLFTFYLLLTQNEEKKFDVGYSSQNSIKPILDQFDISLKIVERSIQIFERQTCILLPLHIGFCKGLFFLKLGVFIILVVLYLNLFLKIYTL